MNKKYKDIHTGDKYGNWVVLDENDFEQKSNYKKILCKCQCINKTIRYVDERNLKNGNSTSCGKCLYPLIRIGDRFEEWIVLEDENENTDILCKCSCGTIRRIDKRNLHSGDSTNCGCLKRNNHYAKNQYTNTGKKIIVGNNYNKWTVLQQVKTESYLCECSCFNHTQKVLSRSQILSGRYNGCKKCRLRKNHMGETYGYLTIISIDEEKSIEKNRIYVNAKCKCGNIHSYEQQGIIKGRFVSCGCKKHEIDSNLVGRRFGYLVVTKLIGRKYTNGDKRKSYIEWKCKCDCGNTKNVRQGNLLSGSTLSCGCMKRSHGEELIYKYLRKNKFIFEEQYRFNDCKNILPLPFDFALLDENRNVKGLIEFDGKQHFTPYQFNNHNTDSSILKLYQYIERDKIKTNYCKSNNIELLRITYEDLEDGNWIYILWDFLYSLNLIIDI